MHSRNKIDIHEVNGIEQTNYVGDPDLNLDIESHYDRQEWVVITISGVPAITVSALDLLKAVNNATNV